MTDIDTWRRVLDAIEYDEPPATEIAEQLAAALDTSMKRAQEQVYEAIDDGILVEEGEGFGGVRLAAEYRENDTNPYAPSDAATPLDRYGEADATPRYAYAVGNEDERHVLARDAALTLTASNWGPPHNTRTCDQTDPWADLSYRCATHAVEHAIVDALLSGGEGDETDDSPDIEGREAGSSGDEGQGEDTEDTGVDHDHPTGEPATVGDWSEADFSAVESRTWAPEQIAVEAWMCRSDDKAPYSPWTDADAPVRCTHSDHDEPTWCNQCEHSAEYKWGSEGSHEHVHADHETALEWAEMVPSLSSDLVFIQRDEDPFAFIDGDDVRDPETGEVHPAFEAILEHLGVTYADISTSGTGVHAVYRGEIPLDGVPQATFDLDDEPWGANDDAPAIEIYDGKHVCIATGEHVAGTGTEIAEWDDDAVADILRANGFEERTTASADNSLALDDHTPTATTSTETTDDINDLYYAISHLDSRRVADDTIVNSWNDDANTSGNNRAFDPTWGAKSNGTANIVNDEIWQDTGGKGYGGADVMAAIDCNDLPSYDEDTQPGDLTGADWFRAVEHLRDLGYEIPELERDESGDGDYESDPRELQATVDPRRAWDAAGRVSPDDLESGGLATTDGSFVCPDCNSEVDVVRAVAIEEGLADGCDSPLDADTYPEAYTLARTDYGAPLPEYYTTADAIAEWDAVLDVISEITFDDLDLDAITTETTATGDEVGGDAVRAMDPAWRESESGESVLVFETGTVWDADTERLIDALRFVALDSGLLSDPTEQLAGEDFTEAYHLARTEYGAPLPRWEPAVDGTREVTPQLPPSEELLDECDLTGVDVDELDAARDEVEALIRERARDSDTPTIVTTLPATGKTTGTVKVARDRPMSYLAPRKELQQQALEKADEWDVDAFLLPVFSDRQIKDQVLENALSYVRENGKSVLRDRWQLLSVAVGDDDLEDAEIFASDDEDGDSDDEVTLDRATDPTADGKHGDAWALAVHVARALGYTPQQIHAQAQGLFGTALPCEDDGQCAYSKAWEEAADPEDPYDLLIGSYIHAHVESVRTAYSTDDATGDITRDARTVVLDEFIGEVYTSEFDEHADDHARWLASSLREDIEDRRDMYEADLYGDEWVQAWLRGEAEDIPAVATTLTTLGALSDLFDARDAAAEILREVDHDLLETFGLCQPLDALTGDGDHADVCQQIVDAVEGADRSHPAAGVVAWIDDAVREPLERATDRGGTSPEPGAIDVDALPVAGDLAELVAGALEAVEDGEEGALGRVRAAATALRGGDEGCRTLAAWADDGYAHPEAHHLLEAVVTPTGDDSPENASRIETSAWAFDPDATDGTTVDVVETGARATTVLDRNGHGARLHTPPDRTHGGGGETPLIGLDATGRAELWRVALGEPVETADIHETPEERAAFLEDALDLRVLQASDQPRYYSGDPGTKDTDGDAALLQAIDQEYSGIDAPRKRGDAPQSVGAPAAITTKGVEEVLKNDSRLDDVVAEWEHFGNLTGANDLGNHRLGAVLGCQHYGDDAIERFAALEGESVDVNRDGRRGRELDYGSRLANQYLQHMTEDQVTQAVLRFARGDSGATVVARTGALREDLPVVGEAQVLDTWNETATEIARAYRRLGAEFTIADVRDVVDVGDRQVRRILTEFVEAGYLQRVSSEPGVATVYGAAGHPGAGEVDLPARDDSVGSEPGHATSNEYYTWNVRVFGVGDRVTPTPARSAGAPPAPPAASAEGDPPDTPG